MLGAFGHDERGGGTGGVDGIAAQQICFGRGHITLPGFGGTTSGARSRISREVHLDFGFRPHDRANVTTLHHDGASADDVAGETGPLDLQVVRGILEPDMVRLAIVNLSPRKIDGLGKTLSEMENVQTDAARFARLEDDFHRQLAEGTGNAN